jgi:hypothetical protein
MKGPHIGTEKGCSTFYMYSIKEHETGKRNYNKTLTIQFYSQNLKMV